MMILHTVDTILGRFSIGEEGGAIVAAFFENVPTPPHTTGKTPLLRQAEEELLEYLAGRRRQFTLPLGPKGSPFMERAWQGLLEIPYGETRTYRQQAQLLGSAGAARAVGLANSRNPIPIFIPCHRLVGSSGSLTGFRGGVAMKAWLLALERGEEPDTPALEESLGQMRASGGQMPIRP